MTKNTVNLEEAFTFLHELGHGLHRDQPKQLHPSDPANWEDKKCPELPAKDQVASFKIK